MRAWASDAVVRASFSLLSFSYPIPPRLFFLSIIFIFLFYYYSLFQAFLLTNVKLIKGKGVTLDIVVGKELYIVIEAPNPG
jgi:hypothetical protein